MGVLVEGTLMLGILVEGTLTDGTLVGGTFTDGTLVGGTLTPGKLTPATLTAGAVTEGTATVDGRPGTDTAPATVLTDAPRAAPQRPAANAFTVVCRRLRLCAGMFSALPSDTRLANASCSERYSLLEASTFGVRLVKKDPFDLRVGVASLMAERGGDDSPS
jgi:hypothetical protein